MTCGDDKGRSVPRFSSYKPNVSVAESPREGDEEYKSGKPRSIPKFASFKQSQPEVSLRERATDGEDTRPAKRHKRHKNDHGQTKAHSRQGSRAEESGRERHREPTGLAGPAARDAVEGLFFFDLKGDPLMARYGGNDQSKVPAYRRFGGGRVLGSDGFLELRVVGRREEFSIRRSRWADSSVRDKGLSLAKAARIRGRRIKPGSRESSPGGDDDFVPLTSSKTRNGRRRSESPVGLEQPDYRSVEGKAKTHRAQGSVGSDSEELSQAAEDGEGSEMTQAQKRCIDLGRRVQEHAEDTASWLELVQVQDSLFAQNHGATAARTQVGIKALSELKMALYEKALPHASSKSDREKLLRGIMGEGAKLWSPEVLDKRWDKLAEGGDVGFALWRDRLDFEMTNLKTFSFEKTKGFLLAKLDQLRKRLQEAAAAADAGETLDQLIYVFLRLTRFLFDAGYTELAVAAWQGMLEMTFARPADERAESAISSFADFWESEAPRFGEEDWQPWAHFKSSGAANAVPPVKKHAQSAPATLAESRDAFKAWGGHERREAALSRMPARMLDEGNQEDPFRVVVASDLEHLLTWFPAAVLKAARPRLMDAFLMFCHLPPALMCSSLLAEGLNDPFLGGRSSTLEAQALGLRDDPVPGDLGKRKPRFWQHGGSMAISPDVLFPGPDWFRYMGAWADMFNAGDSQVDQHWVRRCLHCLCLHADAEDLAEYYLAFEWWNEAATARKTAKTLLKKWPSNIRLYNAYALIELVNGNIQVAEKVLMSATGLSADSDSQVLWNTWTWAELARGRKREALGRLCSAGAPPGHDIDLVSPALLLKTRCHLSSARDYNLSGGRLENAVQYAESLVLLDFLTATNDGENVAEGQGNIIAAMTNVGAFSQELCSRGLGQTSHHEGFLQFAARLLYHQASHGPYRPAYVCTELRAMVGHFPRNTMLLSLFAWAETGLRIIDDPVRALLAKTSLAPTQDGPATRIFAIHHELVRGTVHSARAAFEAAVDASSSCHSSAGLWASYVRFCRGRRELRPHAVQVLHRALGACPWAKDLYMEAFGTLVGDMASAELRGVFDAMVMRGLRIHVDLEHFLGTWKRKKQT